MYYIDKILLKASQRQSFSIKKILSILKKGPIAVITSLCMIFELLGMCLFGLPVSPSGQKLDLSDYHLVLEDEFEGDSLDLSTWAYRASGARRKGFNSPATVSVKDGNLIIKAEYLEDGDGTYGPGWYAGMITTHQSYLRGYFEIKCICSKGGGNFWSAFWLNSPGMSSEEASNGGIGGAEIDIFEAFNYKKGFLYNDSIATNVHVGGYGDGLSSLGLGDFFGKNIYTEYNTYGLEWTEDEYIFYINGVETVRTSFRDGVSQAQEYPIISLEIPDNINCDKDFTTEFIVDSVRIYQK